MSDEHGVGELLDAIALPKLALSGRGRAPRQLTYTIVREVTQADIEALAQGLSIGAPLLATITARHHRLAQMLADGTPQAAAAAATGYTPNRVCILASDPMIKELIEYYRTQKEARYLDVHERLATLGATAGEILQDRMEERPEAFDNRELVALMEAAFDRSVAPAKGGPKAGPGGPQTAVQVNVNFVKPPEAQPLEVPSVEVKSLEGPLSDGD